MFRTTFLILLSLVVSACIPVSSTRMPDTLSANATGPSGFVFGSLGGDPYWAFNDQRIIFRKVGTTDKGSFSYASGPGVVGPRDVEDSGRRAMLFVEKLPAGQYELVDIDLFLNQGYVGTKNFHATELFSVRFTIVEGHATYLGEFISYPILGKNLFGYPVILGGYYNVRDQIERDRMLLKKKAADAGSLPVDSAFSAVSQAGLPYFKIGQ